MPISISCAEKLRKAAGAAAKFAYSPYSKFSVGAALLCDDGRIFSGCNVESVSFSPTICAERVAIVKAVSEGARKFLAICIMGGAADEKPDGCYPCGVCRQSLAEFCDDDFTVIVPSGEKNQMFTLSELLPQAFRKF